MTPNEHPIAIVGGGIGGLTAAVALHNKGFEVCVYEAAPSYRHVGGGHWLYANALQTLHEIDPTLVVDMQALGKGFDGFLFTTNKGTRLLHERTAPFTLRTGFAPVVMHRADIIGQLAKRLPKDRLHFGKRLRRYADNTLEFEDGTSAQVSLLIGADGIHSRVRRDTLTDKPPRNSLQVGLWGISPYSLPPDTGRYFQEMWGDGVRFGFTYVGAGEVYWFMVVKNETVPTEAAARKDFILDKGRQFPPQMIEVIRQTEPEAIHVNPLYDVAPLKTWHTDTVCCLGDAVHACTPNLGQGGCQAIEDGYWLAEMLEREASAEEAFARFQKKRFWKVMAVVYFSRWLGNLAQTRGRPFIWFRNAVVWLLPVFLLRGVLRWIMTLPDGWFPQDSPAADPLRPDRS